MKPKNANSTLKLESAKEINFLDPPEGMPRTP